MNNVINTFLLAGDKFMPEMHLRQPQFVYSACGPFTRHKERIKKFKQTGDTRYIYRNDLDKACFQHDSAYADHKDLINRTEADKVLKDKVYHIASNPEYDGYQRGLASRGGFLFLKFGQRGGSWKNCSEIGGGGLVEKGGVQIVSSDFLQKSMFSLLLKYFFFFLCLVNIHACCN